MTKSIFFLISSTFFLHQCIGVKIKEILNKQRDFKYLFCCDIGQSKLRGKIHSVL
jgi:hypothetical protein